MKINHHSTYECEICHENYGSAENALECESRPIKADKFVKIGDTVRIVRGDGAGYARGKVTKIVIYSKDWGHYQREKYWHTVGLVVDLIDEIGSRALTFDDYEVD